MWGEDKAKTDGMKSIANIHTITISYVPVLLLKFTLSYVFDIANAVHAGLVRFLQHCLIAGWPELLQYRKSYLNLL